MDINDFRSWHTVAAFIAFIGVWAWAWSKRRKQPFSEAANLPFADDVIDAETLKKENLS